MTQGLNIERLVRVEVDLTPTSVAPRGFGILLIVGDSDVINGQERLRTYVDINEIANDFGTTSPEYLASELYFEQVPQPLEVIIGRWIRTPTAAILEGAILTVAEQDMSNWTPILDGSFSVTIDGVVNDVTGLDFSSETNLNGVASVINAAPTLLGGTIQWDGERFIFTSNSTGSTSTISFLTPEGSGTDISAQLKMTSTTGLAPINGFDAETPLDAVVELANISGVWYACSFASSVQPTNSEYIDVAEFIEATTPVRVFCVTETNTLALDAAYTMDLGSEMKALSLLRTTVQYSENPYAVVSFFGRASTVDFNANLSTITLMYKQEPGVVAETITNTQANTLEDKRLNVFVTYQNNTAIIQYGVMSGNAYFDEVHGLDWFSNALQTALYNLLFTSATKIPQTDAGQNQLINTCTSVCAEAINNGLIAPGTWNADGFGNLNRGDFLENGYYIFTQPMALQDQAIREQRIAPPIQIAVKLSGAIQEIDVIVQVNR